MQKGKVVGVVKGEMAHDRIYYAAKPIKDSQTGKVCKVKTVGKGSEGTLIDI